MEASITSNSPLPKSQPFSDKENHLRSRMHEMGSVLVAFSGGVDSTYLALVATQELGENARCVLGISPSVSQFQRDAAISSAREFEFNFEIIETSELDDENYRANPTNRCYFCKSELYTKLHSLAGERHIDYIIDGTNADDLGGHRPGHAAASENGVRSPLAELGFSKDEIRQLSREQGIEGWEKPSSPCLSSRIAYGVPVTIKRLSMVERGEDFLRVLGFREFRVRVHGDLARLEISPAELSRAFVPVTMSRITKELKKIGFQYVTLDLQGFRSGSMNEALETVSIN